MKNIVYFKPKDRPRSTRNEAQVALDELANAFSRLAETELQSKRELQRAIELLELSCLRTREFISLIVQQDQRSQVLSQVERIEGLVQVAKVKASLL